MAFFTCMLYVMPVRYACVMACVTASVTASVTTCVIAFVMRTGLYLLKRENHEQEQ